MLRTPTGMAAVFVALAAFASPSTAGEHAGAWWQPHLERREQRLVVRFRSAAAARRAGFSICRLRGGKRWSVSSRWDDLNRKDRKMRDVLAEHGYRGTWYLNEPRERFDGEFARELLSGGNSIGCHSMTHPFLPMLCRNRIFWEVAAVRARWEAATDTTICSFAFPFLAHRNDIEGDALHRDMADMLRRAGYYHVPLGWFDGRVETGFVVSPLLPPDGKPIEERARSYLEDPDRRRSQPHISFSMHVWYDTPEGWARFEEQLDRYGRRPDWWYCNQSQYAAYTYQQRHTELQVLDRNGDRVTVRLLRPVLRELNDPVPLTIAVEGVNAEQVTAAESPHARSEVNPGPKVHEALIDLYHEQNQRLPTKIGLIRNPDNRSEVAEDDSTDEFPDLQALLSAAEDELVLTVRNSGRTLRDVRVTFRLPPAYAPGLMRRKAGRIENREQINLPLRLEKRSYKYRAGVPFFVAQLNFTRGDRPGRLHLTCRGKVRPRDPSFPQGGFSVLGPISPGDFDLTALLRALDRGGNVGDPSSIGAETDAKWRAESQRALATLDPEVVETSGGWRNQQGEQFYVLRSNVYSHRAGPVRLLHDSSVSAARLNGENVLEQALLRSGRNELVVIARLSGRSFHMTNAGSMLRLTRPGESERLAGLRYGRGD